ncbi:1313_t:CDS:1, partial [Acaulospora morrowiae]
RELYNKWGGIPRYVLFHALNPVQQSLLENAINLVDDKILNFVGEITDGNDGSSISHKLVHICTNVPEGEENEEDEFGVPSTSTAPTVTKSDKRKGVAGRYYERVPFYNKCILEFASDYVSEKAVDRLSRNYKYDLQNFVNTSEDMSEYSTLRGAIFERLAHQRLLRGGKFNVRPLFEDSKTRHTLQLDNNMGKLTFSDIKEIAPKMYCIPIQKNNASFDAIIPPNMFFQMTVAKSHPIIKSGLEKYIERIDQDDDIKFYFVLPKEIYHTYKEQALYTTKRTVVQNKPAWFSRFKQYALELNLKL